MTQLHLPYWRALGILPALSNLRVKPQAKGKTCRQMAKKATGNADEDVATCAKEVPAAPPAAPATKPKKSESSSSSSLLFIMVPLLVALIGGAWTTLAPSGDAIGATRELSNVATRNASSLVGDESAVQKLVNAVVKDKYESEIVHIDTQKLLTPTPDADKCPDFAVQGDLAHVETVMGNSAALKKEQRVFLMLNGQNEGISVNWDTDSKCLRELATFAAQTLGMDVDILANGVKLMSQDGLPIATVEELDQLRIAHVLFDGQIWVWPGIKVGHKFMIENYKIMTASLRPKVFTVEGFFTQEEADSIMKQGIDRLSRSPVDSPEAVDGYHSDRTSYTAFLNDNQFTRDFRVRTAKLTRLPSPSFVERLQLVRYETGQFFRKHEDYFDSKQFIPKKELASQEYEAWTKWASTKIQELSATHDVPERFRKGGAFYPRFEDQLTFQHSLLQAFIEDVDPLDFFVEHADVEWGKWIKDNLANKANDIIGPLMKDKGYMLPHMVKAWEARIGLPELHYKIPKRPLSGVTHYFRWIRWAKERTQDLLDTNPSAIPAAFRPEGPDYPTYHIRFQNRLVKYILEDNTQEELAEIFTSEWADWLVKNQNAKDVLIEALRATTKIFDLIVKSWTKRAGEAFAYMAPEHLHHFEPNRFVTVFLYLNDCPEGGETVFPYSKERMVTGIKREGMDECSEGLAVPPTKLFASMFYSQTPMNDVDPASLHGGCPPHQGVKYGANSFAWNADADEGANAWDLGSDLKLDPHAEDDDDK